MSLLVVQVGVAVVVAAGMAILRFVTRITVACEDLEAVGTALEVALDKSGKVADGISWQRTLTRRRDVHARAGRDLRQGGGRAKAGTTKRKDGKHVAHL